MSYREVAQDSNDDYYDPPVEPWTWRDAQLAGEGAHVGVARKVHAHVLERVGHGPGACRWWG